MMQEQLGKYQLLERLGKGGMGEVRKARDTQLQRYVAIKLLNADLRADPDFVAHFMREAQLVASLRHPNIVQIHDFQSTSTQGSDVRAYMVMDYIEGGTLADFLRDTVRQGRMLSPGDIIYLFTAISLALDYAHGTGMVHRDIKPANILLDRSIPGSKTMGEPVLTDFGIARLQGSSASTATRSLLGTPLYISPEQAESRAIDGRSDLYSLGIVLYEMLTGITPFQGDNPVTIMMRHLQEQPLDPALINPNISPALSAVVLRSIAKEPQARFPSATAMTVALAQAFNVQVPARLRRPEEGMTQLASNPLQPLSGITPFSPSSLAVPSALNAQGIYARSTPVMDTPSSQGIRPVQPGRRRWLLLTSVVCLLFLLGISAVFVPRYLSSRTASPSSSSIQKGMGQITFVGSSNASQGSFDQLRIDLTDISAPPEGETYYAWLVQNNSEAVISPHWQLQLGNGAIHGTFSYPQYSDLLSTSDLFLITVEDTTSPDIPNLDLSKRLYYAAISHVSSSPHTFTVEGCPIDNTNNATNPCR